MPSNFSAQISTLPSKIVNNILIALSMFIFFRFRPVFHICVVCVLLNVTICHSETQLLFHFFFFVRSLFFFFPDSHCSHCSTPTTSYEIKSDERKFTTQNISFFHAQCGFSYALHFDMYQHHCTSTFQNNISYD